MNKQEYIGYWLISAKKNLKTVENLFKTKDYVPALFFMHLHLEKLWKALWVKNNKGNHPPRIHNLIAILHGAKVNCTDEQLDLMLIMNNFQLYIKRDKFVHFSKCRRHDIMVKMTLKNIFKSRRNDTIIKCRPYGTFVKFVYYYYYHNVVPTALKSQIGMYGFIPFPV